MKICVLGLGYIGLPTAAILAARNNDIFGVDVKEDIVAAVNAGTAHIAEPALSEAVAEAVSAGRLKASLKHQQADVFIITVPTPFKEGHEPDISYVIAAAESIIPFVRKGNIVILESTSPVGTTSFIVDLFKKAGLDTDGLFIAYCPERVLPGKIMHELINNDRIIGGVTPAATDAVAAFYSTFVQGGILKTNDKTAEMVKLSENAFRDVNVAYANELSMLCDDIGIDVWELIRLANRHPRVKILSPGCGVGGHCIAVDPWFIVSRNPGLARVIKSAREQNDFKSVWCVEKIEKAAAEFMRSNGRKPVIACMGLAFKPDVDDLRESPAVSIAANVAKLNFEVLVTEPNISSHSFFKLITPADASAKADIVVYLVAHSAFKQLRPKAGAIVLDFCGVTKTA